MRQNLEQKLAHRLTMTPQLKYSLRLLSLSNDELRAEIEREYLSNPTLEIEYAAYNSGQGAGYDDCQDVAAPSADWEQELGLEISLAFSQERQRLIAIFLVDSLDERGFLTLDLGYVAEFFGVRLAEVQEILRRLQDILPPGAGAKDLAECLRLQAERRGIYTGLLPKLIEKYLIEVANGQIARIAAAEKTPLNAVQAAVSLLKTLNPNPGCRQGRSVACIVPDIIVKPSPQGFNICINDAHLPRLTIVEDYRSSVAADDASRRYISQCLTEAKYFIKGISKRRDTLQKVVAALVTRQAAGMAQGLDWLEPLTMRELAAALNMHESTVSRTVANKFVQLPWGVVPLKNFFAAGLGGDEGENFAAGRVKAAIKELLQVESAQAPLSDQKIVAELKGRGFNLARRTVMKYRREMGIPSSTERKCRNLG